MNVHMKENVRHCHYYNNDRHFPFEELGSEFLHDDAKICQFGQKCDRSLCPLKHTSRDTKTSKYEENIDDMRERIPVVKTFLFMLLS